MERESWVGGGKGEVGFEDERGLVRGAEEAETGLEGERERRGSSGGGSVGELERRA